MKSVKLSQRRKLPAKNEKRKNLGLPNLDTTCLSVCLSVCPCLGDLRIWPLSGRTVCLFGCMSVCLSACLPACLFTHPSVCPYQICWSVFCPSACLSIHLQYHTCLSAYLSVVVPKRMFCFMRCNWGPILTLAVHVIEDCYWESATRR